MAEVYQLPLPYDATTPLTITPEIVTKVERTFDIATLNDIARHDDIYPHISNDNSPAKDNFTLEELVNNPYNHFLAIRHYGEVVGFWMMLSRTPTILEAHTCILPKGRGSVATYALPLALKYIFTCTPATAIVTEVPATNPEAKKFATWAGFKTIYTAKAKWIKDGKLYDVDVMTLWMMDWFNRLSKAGDAKARAISLVGLLASKGQFEKSQYFYNIFTSLLGDLET